MARKRRKTVIGRKLNSSESSPAAEVIAGIIDLLIEILLHLPAKSLVRFKCVSKQWLSLMSHSEFSRNHSRRNPRPPISGLYFYCRNRLTSVSLSGGRNLPPLSSVDGLGPIQNSCNGLLLCHNRRYGPNGNGFYSVCNLTTQKHTPLPKPNWHSPGSYHFACLAFDPSKSLHYKVVMGSYCSPPPYRIDVYCSQSSCWKQVFAQENCYGPGVFWNGAIHWLSDQRGLIRFEVDAEKMIALPNPPTPKILGVDKVRYFGECGGGLILIQSRSCCVVGFRILEMDKDYHGWIVKCRINLRPLIDESPEMKSKMCKYDGSKVLCVVKGEKEKDFALVLAIPGRKIVSYNLKSKTWDVLRDLAPGESIDYRLNGYAYPFVETLLPI